MQIKFLKMAFVISEICLKKLSFKVCQYNWAQNVVYPILRIQIFRKIVGLLFLKKEYYN